MAYKDWRMQSVENVWTVCRKLEKQRKKDRKEEIVERTGGDDIRAAPPRI